MLGTNTLRLITTASFDSSIVFTVIKIAIIFLELMYMIYAFIVVRQVNIMNKNYTAELAKVFKVSSQLHFFAAVIVLVLSLMLLS